MDKDNKNLKIGELIEIGTLVTVVEYLRDFQGTKMVGTMYGEINIDLVTRKV